MKRGLSLGGLDLTSPKHGEEEEEEDTRDDHFVRRFVPDLIAERLTTDGAICKQELAYYPNSVVGFFDVSGFSNLARQLEETEKRNLERNKNRKRNASNLITVSGKGAEELVNQLNDTLTQLIAVIRQSGGDIIKFAGDAILVVWICRDVQHLAEQVCIATECAVRCCALRSDSGLGLHVGIGAGELVGAHVGGKFGRWEYFIAGEACTQSAKAESFSKLDQVVVSPQAFELLCGMQRDLPVFTHMLVDQGHALIKSLLVSNDLLTRNAVQVKCARLTDTCAKMAEGFVPGPVKEALKSSTIVPGGPRKLTVVFFLLLDVGLPTSFRDEETKLRFLEECQSQALSVQDSAYHYWATLRQFILDDKGFVAIVCLGLPPYFHEDNAVRACKVARRLIKTHKIKAAAGICTGTVFCGIVGSAKRAEYSVAGSCINLAARLMCKAQPGEIWVDAQTKLEASSQLQFDKMPSLPFKGFDQPVDIYSPVFPNDDDEGDAGKPAAGSAASAVAASTSFSSVAAAAAAAAATTASKGLGLRKTTQTRRDALVGMERPTGEISKLLFVGSEDEQAAKIGLLEGEAGSGKTKLVEWALAHNQAKRTVVSNADASEINTPFFVWRAVLQNLLASSPSLVSSPMVRESASLSSLPPTATSKIASSSSSSLLKSKFFPSAFRNAGSNGSSLELVPPQQQQQAQQPPQKKKFLSDKRRSSTESVVSQGGKTSGEQQNLEEMLQSVFPVSRVVLEEEETGGGGSSRALKGIAEDGDDHSVVVAAAAVTATEEAPPVAESKPTSSPYLLDRVVHDRRMRGRRLSALQQILPNLAVPTGVVQSDNEEDGSSPNQSAMEIMLVLLEEIGNVENTLIVIENAHSMDKWSWELLYRIHCYLLGTKVRFLVTYRPFEALLDHPLNQLLNHHQLNLATHAYMASPLRRVSSSVRIPPPTPNAAAAAGGAVPAQRNSGLQAASVSASTTPSHIPPIPPVPPRSVSGGGGGGGGSGPPPQGLLSKTFHRFGDAKPFRGRHGSITSVASGSTNNINNNNSNHYSYASYLSTPLSGGGGGGGGQSTPLLPLDDVIKISIPALTLRETSALLSNQFQVSTGPKLLQFLRNTSKGNPRALFDCYRALQDQGLFEVDPESGIAEENTSLEEIGDLVFAIPQHVRARLQQQFDQLPMQEQLLLKLASVIGPTVSIPLLTQLCSKLEANNLMPMRGLDVPAGLQQLKTKGLLRPLLLSDQPHQPQQQLPYGEGEEEDWGFDNDNTRFIVYSQMLHTFRCQVHRYILAVFQERPLAWRLREDPTLLGNHAVGAEQPLLAFQCFQEAMRRAVLKDEPLDKGRRLWQSCSDVLDGEGGAGHSEDTLQSLALRIHIEVLFAQIAISNSAWEEAKLSLTRALERVEQFNQLAGTDIPTLYTDPPSATSDGAAGARAGAGVQFTACGGGGFQGVDFNSWWRRFFATGTSQRAKGGDGEGSPRSKNQDDVLCDPLETREKEVDAVVLVKAQAKLGLSLLEQVRVFELDTLSRAHAIQTYSERELGHRY